MLPLGPQSAGVLSFAVPCGGPGRSVDGTTVRPLAAGGGSSFCGKSAASSPSPAPPPWVDGRRLRPLAGGGRPRRFRPLLLPLGRTDAGSGLWRTAATPPLPLGRKPPHLDPGARQQRSPSHRSFEEATGGRPSSALPELSGTARPLGGEDSPTACLSFLPGFGTNINTEKDKAASVAVFSDLIRSIERCQSELLEMMEEKQKAAEKHDEDVMKDLEQEITELKERNIELEQISHTEDHLQLIQIHSSMCSPLNTKNWSEISMSIYNVSVEKVRRSLTELQQNLHEKLSEAVLKWMQQFAVDVTLDPDTAHPKLILSDDEKQVRTGDIKHELPDNPKRFNRYLIVLGKEGFSSGRFYYEVQVKGKTKWTLGVARESVDRKGVITLTPDDGFWTVALRNKNEYKACADPDVSLSLSVKPQKVGVFVHYEEGLVSFYDVESRSHIYSYTDQYFTGKLYPYFCPCNINKGKNSEPFIITPVN